MNSGQRIEEHRLEKNLSTFLFQQTKWQRNWVVFIKTKFK
jgi:hypothetical protein